MRPVGVEPVDVLAQLTFELLEPKWKEQQPDALILQRANEPLDDGEAAVLPDGSESLVDAPTATPCLDLLRRELRSMVRDQVVRPTASSSADALEEARDVTGCGLLSEHRDPHHLPGEVIDDDRDPSAEGPSLGKREGKPGDPEAETERDGREVRVPDVVRPLGGHDTNSCARSLGRDRLRPEHPPNGRCAQMQPGAGQDIGDPARAYRGADRSKLLDEVRDELREAVHRLRDLEEGVGSAVVEATRPRRDREWSDEEAGGSLGGGPATSSPAQLATGALVLEDLCEGECDERAVFHLLNLAREDEAYVLITAQSPPTRWKIGLADLASRLRALPVVTLASPDDDLLRAVLVKLFANRRLVVDEGLIAYLTSRMERSFAAARSLVTRLDREALRQKRPLTRALAAELMAAGAA